MLENQIYKSINMKTTKIVIRPLLLTLISMSWKHIYSLPHCGPCLFVILHTLYSPSIYGFTISRIWLPTWHLYSSPLLFTPPTSSAPPDLHHQRQQYHGGLQELLNRTTSTMAWTEALAESDTSSNPLNNSLFYLQGHEQPKRFKKSMRWTTM